MLWQIYLKNHGKNLVIRFTTGWIVTNMAAFAEGMILRNYSFEKHLTKNKEDKEIEDWSVVFQTTKKENCKV